MKTKILLTIPLALAFSSCIPLEAPPSGDYRAPGTSHPNYIPLTASKNTGSVTVYKASKPIATCYTAAPNIENYRFLDGQNEIVIKSRANHGPASVQLFDSRTGRMKGIVKAYEVTNNTAPAWAHGMGD